MDSHYPRDRHAVWSSLTIVATALVILLFAACGGDSGQPSSEDVPIVEPGVMVSLRWTAVGDDGPMGRADRYDIRYALDSIALHRSWDVTAPVLNLPAPSPAGSSESIRVRLPLLPDTTYFFGIKSADAAGNWSTISNIVVITTPPDTTSDRRKGRRR